MQNLSTRNDEHWLADIVLACETIDGIIEGLDEAAFRSSELHRSSTLLHLINIGEAVSRISTTLQNTYPIIQWREIKDFRNYSEHAYFAVDWKLIWGAAFVDAPLLHEQVINILETDFPEFWG